MVLSVGHLTPNENSVCLGLGILDLVKIQAVISFVVLTLDAYRCRRDSKESLYFYCPSCYVKLTVLYNTEEKKV